MRRLDIFKDALSSVKALDMRFPDRKLILSVIEQLNYLIDIEAGSEVDRSRLSKINMGLIAVREFEDLDPVTADKIHQASAEVQKMSEKSK